MVPVGRLLALLTVLGGCTYRVRIATEPPGALVQEADGVPVHAPTEIRTPWAPTRDRTVTVEAPGYRPVTVVVRAGGTAFPLHLLSFLSPLRLVAWLRSEDDPRRIPRLEIVLVREHPPTGLWTPESQRLE